MTSRSWSMIGALASLLIFATLDDAIAQQAASTKYLRGQSIQPVYEGWEENPDGTYTMWFGYLNRNWDERITVPVGPDNHMQPGGPDRGQPTIFYTGDRRRQVFAFKVVLPKDWPKDRDLVWTLTANGTTLKAIGSLWPVWLVGTDVISANRGAMRDTDPDSVNKAPVVTEPVRAATIAVGTPLTLSMAVTDDDQPKRRRPGVLFDGTVIAGGGTATAGREGAGRGRGRGSADGGPPIRDSLRVTWVQWRGPGVATFQPDVARVLDADGKQTGIAGRAATSVTFDKPGTYVLKAYAEDMSLFSLVPDITVTVTEGAR